MANLSRGQVTPDEIRDMIASARPGPRESEYKPPKKETIADKLAALPHGVSWYDHLSGRFCDDQSQRPQRTLLCPEGVVVNQYRGR